MKKFKWLGLVAFSLLVAYLIAIGTVRFSEGNPQAAFRRGLESFQKGDFIGLQSSIQDLEGKVGFEPHFHLFRGIVMKQSGQLREALEELANSLGDNDTTALALALSGEILYSGSQYLDAERMLKAAIQVQPDMVDAHRYLIATYYDLGAMDNALVHIAKVHELAPEDIRPWRLEGLILKDFEKYDEALRCYDESLKRSPAKEMAYEIRTEAAECLIQLRRHEDALKMLKGVPPTAETLGQQCDCWLALGRDTQAEVALADGLRINPLDLRLLKIEITLLLEKNLLDKATGKLQSAIAHHPFDFNLRSLAMQAYQKQGATAQADAQQAKMTQLRELKDKFTALHIQAIRDPNDLQSRVQLGVVAEQLGMYDAAVNWYKVALGMNPAEPVASARLRNLMNQPAK